MILRRSVAVLALAILQSALPASSSAAPPVSSEFAAVAASSDALPGPFQPTGFNPYRDDDITTHVSGAVLVTFHGDRASGCAARGLCGYAGAVAWYPEAGDLNIQEAHGRHGIEYWAELNESNADGPGSGTFTVAGVSWTPPGAAAGTTDCTDTITTPENADFPFAVSHGGIKFTLAGGAPSILQTRCAGPLASDLASALSVATVPVARVLNGGLTVSLAGDRSFAADGFAGQVDSTVKLRLGHANFSSPAVPAHGKTQRWREVDVHYSASLLGTADERIRADRDTAECGPLGACGLKGTLELSAKVSNTPAILTLDAPATTPYRQMLTGLGLAPGRVTGANSDAYGDLSWNAGGQLTANEQQNGSTCKDASPLGPGQINLFASASRITIEYSGATVGGPAPLRTRCPGPYDPPNDIASATVPLSSFGTRVVKIRLTRPQSFTDDGYSGSLAPDLRLTLKRLRVSSFTFLQSS